MNCGLFDCLRGSFDGEQLLMDVSKEEHRVLSIVGNLNRLFNTRQGAIKHLPGFGLPDLSTVYRDMPDTVGDLKKAIKDAVEVYEPRLTRIRVKHRDIKRYLMRVIFILEARMDERIKVRFETTFESHELARVAQYTLSE